MKVHCNQSCDHMPWSDQTHARLVFAPPLLLASSGVTCGDDEGWRILVSSADLKQKFVQQHIVMNGTRHSSSWRVLFFPVFQFGCCTFSIAGDRYGEAAILLCVVVTRWATQFLCALNRAVMFPREKLCPGGQEVNGVEARPVSDQYKRGWCRLSITVTPCIKTSARQGWEKKERWK